MDAFEDGSPSPVHCRHCGELHPESFSHCPKTGRSLTTGRALVGRVISNRYRILALIGEGGMGTVYVAEHLLIGRKVAVKRLHPELASDEKAVARFQREARAAGSTGHENVVDVLDLGYGDDGAPFLVMEYLRGRSLARLLAEEGPLEPGRACKIVGQMLAGLAAVHACGVLHRDLKPDNIILVRKRGDPEFVKIVDFGISKIRREEDDPKHNLTRTGVMLGTPFYMSPEQARGMKNLDHRVDLYGVGIILYECLAGQLPFNGENYHQLLQAILSGNHTAITKLRRDLDPELAELVERAIARALDERFATAVDFHTALVPHGAEAPKEQLLTEPPPPSSPVSQTFPIPTALRDTAPVMSGRDVDSVSLSATTRRFDRNAPLAMTPFPKGIVPLPATLAPTPRRFEAQSPDWRPPPRGTPVAAMVAEPRPAYSSVEPTTGPRRASAVTLDDSGGETDVKGAFVLGAVAHIESMSHDSLPRVLERLGPEISARITEVKLPMSWLRLDDYAAFLRAAERQLASREGLLAIDVGVATANRELTTTHRLFMRRTTPVMAVERIPQFFRAYHSTGRVEVAKAPTGGFRIEAFDIDPDTLPHARAMSGFYRRLVELAGGRDVRSSVVACRERGDERTLTVLRWR